MKKLLLSLTVLFFSFQIFAQTATITEASGWLESAFVKWTPAIGADSYNVYFSGMGIVNRKIDTQLIRSYGTYFRADVLGLQPGNYTIKVVPVFSGIEGSASETGTLTVLPHDRTGFAFANGRVPGAYKADGTLKDNAVIIYITQNTKNTISMNVTGANANPCVGFQAILDGFKKGKDLRPLIVRMIGQITDPAFLYSGDIVVENNNNAASFITIEGVGDDAVADGWGIRIKNASNIELRNFGSMNVDSKEGDNISVQQENDYVWVHNLDLFYGHAGSDADQIKGDGAMDVKRSTYVTLSYNHFWDTGKSNLLGLSEGTTSGLFITYHHNWYDHSDSRHPRVRYYSAHVYNNYYDGIAKYGVGSTMGSSVFVESNLFRNCKYPMLTSMQGTDIFYDGTGTFSSEDGGTIKSFNNAISGQTRYIPYHSTNYPVEFDAVEATTRGEIISSAIKSKKGANTYNNFDTDPAHYVKNLVPDDPETAKTKVMYYAGRVNGCDFKWTFNNAVDDASYAVNTGLKTALTNYSTKLILIQGESSVVNSTQTISSTDNKDQTVPSGTAIEPIVITWGGDATDANVTGLPASGINFVKNTTEKTITISGTPTADVIYTVTTSGISGSPVSLTGTITVSSGGSVNPDMIHNFTLSGKNSSFYSITGNLSTGYGTVSYEGLSLTQCLKMESTTNISFTTTQAGTLALVFNGAYTGTIKIDNNTINVTSTGIITSSLDAGTHTITKGSGSTYLFLMSMVYNTTGIISGKKTGNIENLKIYPNPAINEAMVICEFEIEKIEIFNLSGVKVKTNISFEQIVDISNLNRGTYFLRAFTKEGTFTQKLIKE
jgi:pectate lyase